MARKQNRRKASPAAAILTVLVLAALFVWRMLGSPEDGKTQITLPNGELHVWFLDVGQADSSLLVCDGQAMLIDGGYAEHAAALTSSHFCSAERQYRFPLEYGGVRTPTAQWTVTGSGALILGASGNGPRVTMVTTGKIADAGITDANNMGAAMAPAAYETLKAHFADTGRTPDYYDLIVTGDLGKIGHTVVTRLFQDDGIDLTGLYTDCGLLIYDLEGQDVHAGGSGCGCSASVLAGHLLKLLESGQIRRLLFAATGALMSPTASMQGESIPGICHAVAIETQVNT